MGASGQVQAHPHQLLLMPILLASVAAPAPAAPVAAGFALLQAASELLALRCCQLHQRCLLLLQAGLIRLLLAAVAAALPVAAEMRQPGLQLLVPVEAAQHLLNPALQSGLQAHHAAHKAQT